MKVELVTEYRPACYVEGYDKAILCRGDLLEKMRLLTNAYGDSQTAENRIWTSVLGTFLVWMRMVRSMMW